MNEVTFMKRNSQTPIINAVVNDNNVDEYYPITEEEQQIILKYRNSTTHRKETIHRILDSGEDI
jgi:hypothetical protein